VRDSRLALMADDDGVLGNLPRSRPGRRSGKREAASTPSGAKAQPAKAQPAKSRRTPATARTTSSTPRSRPAAATARAAASAEQADEPGARPAQPRGATERDTGQPRERGTNPIGEALHVAAKVAGTGVRVAEGVARELVRRLPRP
jgi:hypothetical protein